PQLRTRRERASDERLAGTAEAEVVQAPIRFDECPYRQPRPLRPEPERIAAHAAALAGRRADWIERVGARVIGPRLVFPIGDPFADVAAHVVQAEAVR